MSKKEPSMLEFELEACESKLHFAERTIEAIVEEIQEWVRRVVYFKLVTNKTELDWILDDVDEIKSNYYNGTEEWLDDTKE